ncbi:MAG: exo-beta-N-acetylmuramidase NamZ domain-containing protein [Blastocatellia bacterium]
MMTRLFCLLLLLATTILAEGPASLPAASPSSVGMSPMQLVWIDQAVEAEIARKQLPGAVVLVGRHGRVVWRKAYGNRALEPAVEPMTIDTIFDLASLTKIVATATSVMILVERGQVRLGDPVSRYIPEFADGGKRSITVEQLLTHRSGLIADNAIEDYQKGPEKALENIWRLAPIAEVGAKFIYSDVNFITLGELVRRVSGKTLDVFAAENIYRPLGMNDTGFRPAAALQPRIAPTEKRPDGWDGKPVTQFAVRKPDAAPPEHWMRGEVHDPRSYLLGGVAGHAGLFSTADDLAKYCHMILNGGAYEGARVLSRLGVARMTEPRASGGNASDGAARGLGWDYFTSFSANRGDLFPVGSFGHTGFTGTGLWLDPATQTFVVFLSNRVHPVLDPKKPADVGSLRGRVASIVAASILDAAPHRPGEMMTMGPTGQAPASAQRNAPATTNALNGIDVLVRDNFAPLKGRRVGLITNHTGRDREGRATIDLLHKAPDVKLVALFSPEHGIRGVLDHEKITNTTDEKTGLPVYSLYGETRQPTAEMLTDIDTLVFDIQDVGARFYTYISTMGHAMEAAAKHKTRFVVLDRVNPINGLDVAGPIADGDKLSFIAWHRIPVRHGMTVGELAQLFNTERGIKCDLQVIRVEDWRRAQWFDETGLAWINPSPNMRSLTQATLYPGVCLLEPTNVSVGRGTDTPFELIGAPWIDGRKLAEALNNAKLPGVRFVPVRYTPKTSVHKDVECGGVNIIITDRAGFEPVTTGLEMAARIQRLWPRDFAVDKFNRLLVNQRIYEAFKSGAESGALRQVWESELDAFRAIRQKYLLY